MGSWQKAGGINDAQGERGEARGFGDGGVFSSASESRCFWISPLHAHRLQGTRPSGNSGETCCSQLQGAVNPAELGRKGAPLREPKTHPGKTPPIRCVEAPRSVGDTVWGGRVDCRCTLPRSRQAPGEAPGSPRPAGGRGKCTGRSHLRPAASPRPPRGRAGPTGMRDRQPSCPLPPPRSSEQLCAVGRDRLAPSCL